MPTKESRLKRTARKEYLLDLDKAVSEAPLHITHRLGRPTQLGHALAAIGPYRWGGYGFCEGGQATKLMTGANRDRRQKSVKKIQDLAQKYAHIWRDRKAAGIIARLENIPADTVRRYKRLHPSAK